MLYSCTHMATVGVKGLKIANLQAGVEQLIERRGYELCRLQGYKVWPHVKPFQHL